jgi:hypothetical protein
LHSFGFVFGRDFAFAGKDKRVQCALAFFLWVGFKKRNLFFVLALKAVSVVVQVV